MSVHEVKATVGIDNKGKVNEAGESIEVIFNRTVILPFEFYDGDLDKQVEEFGADVVSALFVRAGITSLRNQGTNWIRKELDAEAIDAALSEWKPPLGPVRVKKSKMQKASEAAADMSPEQLDELLSKLKTMKKELAAK